MLSAYGEGNQFRTPGNADSLPASSLRLFASGVTGDVSIGFGTRTQFAAGYRGGYSYNNRYSELNGPSHTAWFELRTDPARHTVLTLGAQGESGLISDALFGPSYLLTVASRAQSPSELSDGILNATAVSQLDSAVDLAISAGRRRAGAAYATVSRSVSRRFTAHLRIGALRELHSYSRERLVAARYPNTTVTTADLDLAFSLSPRTRIHGTAGYVRSASRDYRSNWQTGGIGLERQFGRASFGSVQAGYMRLAEPGTSGFGTSSYTVAGAYGTTKRYHSLALLCRRGMGDLHGLGALSTTECNAAWSWTPPATGWRLAGSLGYERFGGGTLDALEAWVGQASAVRTLGRHFELSFTGVYLSYAASGLASVNRSALRIALAWRPDPERRR
ncbi:MAG: hypothetical protein JST11_16890 [Acidobacteria bacterium]|nr:hypothetical protein [Acidobacteriota bacterium]